MYLHDQQGTAKQTDGCYNYGLGGIRAFGAKGFM